MAQKLTPLSFRAPRELQNRAAFLAGIAVLVMTAGPAHAIINGKDVTVAEQQQRGLVALNSGCSGILLSSDWVITAGHCVPVDRPNPGVTATAAWAPGVSYPSDAIYQFADASQTTNPGAEFALVHLSTPVAGIAPGYRMQLYSGSGASLVGATVAKYGRGLSTLADRNPATGSPSAPGGFGIYRAADLVVDTAEDYRLKYKPNSAGQMLMPGDSGGPGIVFSQGTALLVGITSTATWACFNRMGATAAQIDQNCRDSTYIVNQAHDVSLPVVKAAVEAVLKTTWNPRVTSQPVMINYPELALTAPERAHPVIPVADVNLLPWAHAARMASKMCYNRGFSAGHFDGHQQLTAEISDRSFGLQCSGVGTVWRDATLAEVAASGWGFTDIKVVSWAQANRAAERLCAGANQGFAGGQFNGHQDGDRVGLFCYKDGAQWFDASEQEIANTGWGFSRQKLDDNDWAQAARAATGFCRGKGMSGGFMNGHQVPGKYGVVCQN